MHSPVGEIHGCYENANGQPRYGRDDPDAKTFSFAPVDSPAVLTSMSNVLSKGNCILPCYTMHKKALPKESPSSVFGCV